MSSEKKNPLIGAFRTPPAGAPPSPISAVKSGELPKDGKMPHLSVPATKPAATPSTPTKAEEMKKTAEPTMDDKAVKAEKPAAMPPTSPKAEEVKKPTEPAKDDKAVKAEKSAAAPSAPTKAEETKKPPEPVKAEKPAAAPSTPTKAEEVKKTAEPAKDDKAVKAEKPATTPPTPTKTEEVKKSAEPAKDDKTVKAEKPAATLPTPTKAEETKKPAEPVKDDKAVKAEKPAAMPPTSPKVEEVKKPTEPVRDDKADKAEQATAGTAPSRTADGPKGSAVTKVFEDRLDAPKEADFFDLPIPKEGEIYSMAVHPAYLKDFLDHPFSVNRETQDYKDLYESIKSFGIREPVLCRPGRNGGLEIISGNRRHDIGMQLNYPIPVLIEQVDNDDAQIQCVDGNLHRKDIPISELARAAQMKMDALKRKAGRRSKADILAGKEPMKRSDEQVGEELGMPLP